MVGRRVGEDNPRLECLGLVELHHCIRHNNKQVIDSYLACCSSIQTNGSATALALDNVGLQTLTIVDIEHLYLLALNHICGIHQILVDGNAAYIVQPEGQSRMDFVRAMSALKHNNPALCEGDMQIVEHNCEEKVMAFIRTCDKQKVLVMINFSDKPMDVKLSGCCSCGKVLYSRNAECCKLGGYGILVAQIG